MTDAKHELLTLRAKCMAMLSSEPGIAEAFFQLANLEYGFDELDSALESFDKAISHNPGYAEAHSNKGIILRRKGKLNEALASYDQALSIRPEFAQAHLNRGSVLKELRQFEAALEAYNRAIELKPDFFEAYSNRGVLHQDLKQCDQAIASFERAIALNPEAAELYWNKSICLLLSGKYEEGFKLYEWRWKRETFTSPRRNFKQPLWLGNESLRNKTILLHGEQGFGDSIQFCRYATLVGELGAKVILEVPAPLIRLMKSLPGIAQIIAKDHPLPAFDYQCPLMSLPLAFNTSLSTIPSANPYLLAEPAKVDRWRARLGSKKQPRVGIVWTGSVGHANDMNRSMSLAEFVHSMPPNIQYVCLQKEIRDSDKATLKRNPQILEFTSELNDFTDTAALAACMDLVISVDTSVAHLSAAIGVPTLVMVPFVQDWRWLIAREDSPWYACVKIFRQNEIGVWTDVYKNLKNELCEKFGSSVLVKKTASDLSAAQKNEISSTLQNAFKQHQQGDIVLARALYEKILTINPDHFDALQLLGAIIAQTPDKFDAHELIQHALEIDQSNPVVFNNLGNVLNELQRYDESIDAYERAIEIRPDYVLAHFNLGGIYKKIKQPELALACYDRVIELDPEHLDGYYNRGGILKELNQHERALEDYDQAIRLKPQNFLLHSNRGAALHGLNRLKEALASYDQAITVKPDAAEVLLNRGVILKELMQHELALKSYDRAIAIKPEISEAHSNRGVLLQELGRHHEALESYESAIKLKPDSVEANWNKALSLLLTGQLEKGWELYEYRWSRAVPSSPLRGFKQPLWRGHQSLADKTILLYGEQGFGDSLQFCRYVKYVAQRGARVVLEVPRPLVNLLAKLEGVWKIFATGDALPDFDYQCPLMSLPYAFKTNLNNIPSPQAYLKSDPRKIASWNELLGEKIKPRIGLVWSGSAAHKNDVNRSIVLDELLPNLPRQFQYVSLQKEVRAPDLVTLENNPEILNFSEHILDFTDTAALVECMDLVLTVDTSVAHLSAALGKATWIMLPFVKDWRWLLDRTDSPWYEAVTLYRQERIGDWTPVFERLTPDLTALHESLKLSGQGYAEITDVNEALQRAFAHHQKNELDAARPLYEKILKTEPQHFDALQLLATIEAQTSSKQKALELFAQALTINQKNPVVYFNQANVLDDLGKFELAIESYDRAIALKPDYAQAYLNRGNCFKSLGELPSALQSYERAIALEARGVHAYLKSAFILQELKRHDQAIACYQRAIALSPNNAEAFFNLGNLYHAVGEFQWAFESHARSIALNGRYAEQFYNRGLALQALKRSDEALADYERAIAIKPDCLEALYNRGHILKEQKKYQQAIASYTRAYEINPDYDYLVGTLIHTKMFLCDWRDLESTINSLNAMVLNGSRCTTPFSFLSMTDDLALQRRAAQSWVATKYPDNHSLGPIQKSDPGERIKLGYYSADLHNHATAYLMAQLFELHDQSKFELIAFSFGPISSDPMRARLTTSFDQFIEVGHLSDLEIARLSREMGIDIAIDLKGHTGDSRPGIFACRAAPVQVSYLGYPGTMGAEYMDYLIADTQLIPEPSQKHYVEKIVYMPHCYQVNDRTRGIASTGQTRNQAGLPDDGFVFCCFNNNYKITPSVFDIWMRLLHRVPNSVLWLLEDNPEAASNLRAEARARGISAERLIFAPRLDLSEHLARHRLAGLFLDTLPYNAHTTTSDALWSGLPVLTCIGESFASRVAASLLSAVNLPEMIVHDLQAYEQTAMMYAEHPELLAAVKAKLDINRLTSPLFNTEQFTLYLESAFVQMIDRYYSGQPTAHIYVQ